MPRGKGKFRGWEARTRVFLVLMGENPARDGKREWHQKDVCRALEEGSHDTSTTSVYRHLKKLEEIGLAASREVEPERGIKKKKVYFPNLDPFDGEVLEPEDEGVLETFFEKFGNDFKKRGVEGLDYPLVGAIPDPIVLHIVIREVVFPPLGAAKLRAGEAEEEFEEFVSNGSLDFMPEDFKRLGLQPSRIGIGQYRDSLRGYQRELSEEDVEFLSDNRETIVKLLLEWLRRLSEISVLYPSPIGS